jgi:LPXTG-motif cell wall-anchored protein
MLLLGVAMTICLPAMAQSPQCSDVQGGQDVLSRYPNIQEACQGVVERGGNRYVKFTAAMDRLFTSGEVKLRIFRPDGTYAVGTFDPPSDFQAEGGGVPTTLDQIPRGKQFNIYMPEGRWALASPHVEAATVATAPAVEEPQESARAPTSSGMSELPDTGGPLPLFALLGGLAAALAGGLGWYRRRR